MPERKWSNRQFMRKTKMLILETFMTGMVDRNNSLILELLFQREVLKPQCCPNVSLACKSFRELTEKFRKEHPYESFQNLVQKHGYFVSTLQDFQYAIQHGYIVYDLTIYYLVRHRAPRDVLDFAIRTNHYRVCVCAIVEAWTQDRTDLFDYLFARATETHRAEVRAWILDLQRRNIKSIRI